MPLEVGRYYRPTSQWVIDSTSDDAVLQCTQVEEDQENGIFNVVHGPCRWNNGRDELGNHVPGLHATSSSVEPLEYVPVLPDMPVNPVAVENDTAWSVHSNYELMHYIRSTRIGEAYSRMYGNPTVATTQVVEPVQPEDDLAREYEKIVGYEWVPVRLCGVSRSKLTDLNYDVKKEGPRIEHKDWRERERACFEPTKGRELNTKFTPEGRLQFSWRYTNDKSTDKPIYTPIPEPVQELMKKHGADPIEDHFLHQSRSNKSMISHTENEDKGEADRQTPMKMGKYLRKYYPYLTDPQVAEIASLYRKEIMGDIDVRFARTREEIAEVYAEGPNSCMSYSLVEYATGGVRPVEIYATQDVAVAYIVRDERITARSVCNMISKKFSTIYGDSDVLAEGLDLMGFGYGDLEGCSLLKLTTDDGYLIAPYLDGCQTVRDAGSHLVVDGNGEYEATSTNGILESGHRECHECSNIYHESEMTWSEYNDGYICESCREDYYTYAYYRYGGHQDFIPNSEGQFYEYDFDMYLESALDYFDLVPIDDGQAEKIDNCAWSEIDDQYYLQDDVSWFIDHSDDELKCTVQRADELVQPEDEEYHMLEEDCYEFDGKYYRHEENKEEAENEYQEESAEVA